MTIAQLEDQINRIKIELEEVRQDDEDFDVTAVEVRFMSQLGWPFEYSINKRLITTYDMDEADGDLLDGASDDPPIVYLVEARQERYGRRVAWDV